MNYNKLFGFLIIFMLCMLFVSVGLEYHFSKTSSKEACDNFGGHMAIFGTCVKDGVAYDIIMKYPFPKNLGYEKIVVTRAVALTDDKTKKFVSVATGEGGNK